MKLLAGMYWYRDRQVPENCKLFKIKSGEECYLSGIEKRGKECFATIYVFERSKFVEVNFNLIEKYL